MRTFKPGDRVTLIGGVDVLLYDTVGTVLMQHSARHEKFVEFLRQDGHGLQYRSVAPTDLKLQVDTRNK